MAAPPPPFTYYELYQKSSIGWALTDALDDLIAEGRIAPQLAIKIRSNFDRHMADILQEKVKATLSFKASLDTYRFCDDVWSFLLRDVTFKFSKQSEIKTGKVRIVACNSRKTDA